MFKRLHNSFAFRFPVIFYKRWLTIKKPFKPFDKPFASFNFTILCGKVQYPFLKQELLSIQKQFKKLPFIYLYLDFDFSEKLIDELCLLYPVSKLKIISALDCIGYHTKKGNSTLVEFASKNPMGLKLAAILQTLDNKLPVVYADTDVLWLGDPIDDIERILKSTVNIHMQYDYQPGYDFNLVEKAQLKCLYEAPFYCAGLMVIKQLNDEQIKMIDTILPILVEKSEHLSEQTIFAYLQKTTGLSCLSAEKYILNYDGQFEIRFKAKKEWLARHYIGPVRHLFWRDAFYN